MKKYFYRVKDDDTVLSVSNKFCVPACVIIKTNYLCGEISSGDMLYIEKEDAPIYKVKPNETASSVAKKFNVDKEELLKKNGVQYLFYGLIIYI